MQIACADLRTILFRGLTGLVLPPTCGNCRAAVARHAVLCARCWASIRFISPPCCSILGTPFSYDIGSGAVSADAIANPPPFARARAAAVYGDVARDLVHRLKYQDRLDLVAFIAGAMFRAGADLAADADRIVPVPLHRWRLWLRRYNQAALVAAAIARRSGVTCDPLALRRIRSTRRQVGLTASEREDNVRGAFRVPASAEIRVRGRRMLLVDDVYTSGATVRAAARALKRAGASEVDVLTFARVVRA